MIKSIRGAITVDSDTEADISAAAVELINEIAKSNRLKPNNIINIIISSTPDITASYPAKAVRLNGYENVPIFSALEPDIKDSLRMCIRMLLTVDVALTNKPKHIYLKEAKNLRPDLDIINIAIDGPSGAGKSTVAKAVAKRLEILYLDTGAMYRAAALKCLMTSTPVTNLGAVVMLLQSTDINVVYTNGEQHIYLDGVDVNSQIRKHEISAMASAVSTIPEVRLKLVELQREIASKKSSVLDGRDIGTYVLPNAKYKFFMTASAEIRAERRFKELVEKGDNTVTYEQILEDIIKRDENDTGRVFAPLRQAKDAELIDTGNMTEEEVVDYICKSVTL